MAGNRKPQTFKVCPQCTRRFGPVEHLKRKYCSVPCKLAAARTGRRHVLVPTPEARRAHEAVRRAIKAGSLVRPSSCESCGRDDKPIEAAHYDYADRLRVRWLCRLCHVGWDHAEPKGGYRTVAV